MSQEKIYTEKDMHELLSRAGFMTNHNKHENENGTDIMAIKDGLAYNIEHKKLEKRDNGVYRYGGNIKGDICALSTPKGNLIFVINEETSLTKTARFIDEVFK